MRDNFLKGAFIISLGGVISKLIGALYRIPLLKYLGSGGMGLYQLVFPLYCMLLTISASGIPSGIARIISSGQCPHAEKSAFRLYSAIGLLGTAVMCFLSGPLALAQGEEQISDLCLLLAPSVFFVSILSVVRGFFQGRGNMSPTAVTEVLEQSVKVALSLVLLSFAGGGTRGVSAAIFAVTISECVAALYSLCLYKTTPKRPLPLYYAPFNDYKAILKYTIPLTLTAAALPLSQLAESTVVVWLLRMNSADATALWGVFSGCAVTLINLPVSIKYGLAAAWVPKLSPLASSDRMHEAKRQCARALILTAAVAVPCAAALFIFSPLAAQLIFSSLPQAEKDLLVLLVKVMAVNAVTSSLVQTSSACLTALGKPVCSTKTQWLASLLRVALSALLVRFTALGTVAVAISYNVCYLVAVLLNLWYIYRVKGEENENYPHRFRNKARTVDALG